MNLFDDLNWRHTKLLLTSFGAWPFQSRIQRIILTSISHFMLESMLIPEIIKLIIVRNNLEKVADCIPLLILHLMVLIKILSCHKNIKKAKNLLLRVQRDWQLNLNHSEKEILREDGRNHKTFMDLYYISMYSSAVIYMLVPMTPLILDFVVPLNESRPSLPFYQAEYFIDQNKYSTIIYLCSCLVTPITPTVFVAFDSIYSCLIQHSCSMLTVVGRRLQSLSDSNDHKKNGDHFDQLVNCIKIHKEVIEFVELVENYFTNSLFVLLGIIIIGISFTGFQTIIMANKLLDKIRIGWFGMCQVVHLYVLSYFGQKLLDHSEYIYKSTCLTKWHNFPCKTRLLIVLIILRSKKLSKISAGKLYVMSVENFTSVMKKSISYFTVLTSVN